MLEGRTSAPRLAPTVSSGSQDLPRVREPTRRASGLTETGRAPGYGLHPKKTDLSLRGRCLGGQEGRAQASNCAPRTQHLGRSPRRLAIQVSAADRHSGAKLTPGPTLSHPANRPPDGRAHSYEAGRPRS